MAKGLWQYKANVSFILLLGFCHNHPLQQLEHCHALTIDLLLPCFEPTHAAVSAETLIVMSSCREI